MDKSCHKCKRTFGFATLQVDCKYCHRTLCLRCYGNGVMCTDCFEKMTAEKPKQVVLEWRQLPVHQTFAWALLPYSSEYHEKLDDGRTLTRFVGGTFGVHSTNPETKVIPIRVTKFEWEPIMEGEN